MVMKPLDPEILNLARTRRGPYLAAISAPGAQRADLLALLALDAELSRIASAVSEHMLGRIRLQWWQDALADGSATHPALVALAPLNVDAQGLSALVEAYTFTLEVTPATVPDHVAFATASGGTLAALLVDALGVEDHEACAAARDVGTAWALTETLSSGRRVASNEDAAALRAHALALLGQARARSIAKAHRRKALPVLLLARLAMRCLNNPHDPLGAGAVLSVWWGGVVARF